VWTVPIGNEFEPKFLALPQEVQEETLVMTRLLQAIRPQLGRPNVDALDDSKYARKGRK